MVRLLSIAIVATVFAACTSSAEEADSTDSIPVSPTDSPAARIDSLGTLSGEGILDREVVVYLPKGYNGEHEFPVIYMHDGQMLFRPGWNGQEWGLDEYFDSASVRAIVVGMSSTKNRWGDYMPNEPREEILAAVADHPRFDPDQYPLVADAYLEFIVDVVKLMVDERYATLPDRDHTFISGSSMGGLISFFGITQYPEVFGAAACLSTHWPAGDGVVVDAYVPTVGMPDGHRLWMDYGTGTLDSLYEPFQMRVDSMLALKGWQQGENYQSKKYIGAQHNEDSWRERLPEVFGFLLQTQIKS